MFFSESSIETCEIESQPGSKKILTIYQFNKNVNKLNSTHITTRHIL